MLTYYQPYISSADSCTSLLYVLPICLIVCTGQRVLLATGSLLLAVGYVEQHESAPAVGQLAEQPHPWIKSVLPFGMADSLLSVVGVLGVWDTSQCAGRFRGGRGVPNFLHAAACGDIITARWVLLPAGIAWVLAVISLLGHAALQRCDPAWLRTQASYQQPVRAAHPLSENPWQPTHTTPFGVELRLVPRKLPARRGSGALRLSPTATACLHQTTALMDTPADMFWRSWCHLQRVAVRLHAGGSSPTAQQRAAFLRAAWLVLLCLLVLSPGAFLTMLTWKMEHAQAMQFLPVYMMKANISFSISSSLNVVQCSQAALPGVACAVWPTLHIIGQWFSVVPAALRQGETSISGFIQSTVGRDWTAVHGETAAAAGVGLRMDWVLVLAPAMAVVLLAWFLLVEGAVQCMAGRSPRVPGLAAAGDSLCTLDADGCTPLYYAGAASVMKAVIEEGEGGEGGDAPDAGDVEAARLQALAFTALGAGGCCVLLPATLALLLAGVWLQWRESAELSLASTYILQHAGSSVLTAGQVHARGDLFPFALPCLLALLTAVAFGGGSLWVSFADWNEPAEAACAQLQADTTDLTDAQMQAIGSAMNAAHGSTSRLHVQVPLAIDAVPVQALWEYDVGVRSVYLHGWRSRVLQLGMAPPALGFVATMPMLLVYMAGLLVPDRAAAAAYDESGVSSLGTLWQVHIPLLLGCALACLSSVAAAWDTWRLAETHKTGRGMWGCCRPPTPTALIAAASARPKPGHDLGEQPV